MESKVKKLKENLRSGSEIWVFQEKERKWFLDNENIFLKELIADCNGKSIPIRSFSSYQIFQATANFDSSYVVSGDWIFQWFKGIIEDKSYLIERFSDFTLECRVREAYNDIVLSARMSNHSNFLKLVGCCFEFSFPVFVFEYAEHGILNTQGRYFEDLSNLTRVTTFELAGGCWEIDHMEIM